jgi:hypothetical protein
LPFVRRVVTDEASSQAGWAAGSGDAFDASVESVLDWPGVWLDVARDHAGRAFRARERFASAPSEALKGEFYASLVAVAAAALAVEAEKLRTLGGVKSRTPPPQRPWPANKGDHLGQLLVERGTIDEATAESLGRLFDLRNASVHPASVQAPLEPHPVGTNASRELVAYNADVAREMVALAEGIVAAIGR